MTTYYVTPGGSRILNGSRVDQSGVDDGDVINWVKTNPFIIAHTIYTSKGPVDRSYKLRWRNVTDGGSFADVGATGEITYNAATDLVDGDSLLIAEAKCSPPSGYTWQNGLESEADNLLPDAGTYSLADEYYTEFQWALDCSNALAGKQYEFELYEVTNGVTIGTLGAAITMVAGGNYFETLTISGAAGIAQVRRADLAGVLGLAGAAGMLDTGKGDLLATRALPAAAGMVESAAWNGFGAATLAGQAAMALERGLSIADEITLPTTAAIAVAAELGIFKAVSFGSQAGLSLSTVLAAGEAVSLASGAGIAEARVSGILGSTTLPSTAAMVEQSIIDALDSLGLSVAVGISETALKDIAKALSLPSAAAIEVLHSLLIQGVLTLSGAAGVAMVGEVEAGAGQYYENTNLPALAATVYAALLDGLEAIILTGMAATDGVASIAALRELSLTCEANFGLSSVLAAVALTSLSGTPGLSMEGEIVSIPKSLTHILGYSRR